MPTHHANWSDLMSDLALHGPHDSWYFRNFFFFQDSLGLARPEDVEAGDVPEYHQMLRHIYRSAWHTPWNVKSLHDPGRVLTIHNHQPVTCLARRSCSCRAVRQSRASLHHYKADCSPSVRASCQVRDTFLITVIFISLKFLEIHSMKVK